MGQNPTKPVMLSIAAESQIIQRHGEFIANAG
jgi:hypothetical protein